MFNLLNLRGLDTLDRFSAILFSETACRTSCLHYCNQIFSDKESTLKEKNLLSLRANSFF